MNITIKTKLINANSKRTPSNAVGVAREQLKVTLRELHYFC